MMDGSESNGCRAAVLLKPIKVPDDTNKGSVVCVARVIKQPSSVIRLCYDHPHNRALAVILLLVTERKPRICVLIAVRKTTLPIQRRVVQQRGAQCLSHSTTSDRLAFVLIREEDAVFQNA